MEGAVLLFPKTKWEKNYIGKWLIKKKPKENDFHF